MLIREIVYTCLQEIETCVCVFVCVCVCACERESKEKCELNARQLFDVMIKSRDRHLLFFSTAA